MIMAVTAVPVWLSGTPGCLPDGGTALAARSASSVTVQCIVPFNVYIVLVCMHVCVHCVFMCVHMHMCVCVHVWYVSEDVFTTDQLIIGCGKHYDC